MAKKPARKKPKTELKISEEAFSRTKKALESILENETVTESHPLSIYFSKNSGYSNSSETYRISVGVRLNRVFNFGMWGDQDLIPENKLKKIKVETLYSSGLSEQLTMPLASILAIRIYYWLLENNYPCEINFRTYSEESKDRKKEEIVSFSTKGRYKQNTET